MSTTVSIIICTRNRADSLKLTLESIRRTSVPPEYETELLVVDNGSTDSTKAVIAALAVPNLRIRYVCEPRAGKSHAYNTGITLARGDILLFTDDDVRVPTNWIEGMCAPILMERADAVAGGVIFPPDISARLAQPPFSSYKSWFASTEELEQKAPKRMVGANMAFRREVLEQVPGFEIELGPGALGFHDETLFSWQLLAAGYRLISALDIVVEHHFDLTRLTRKGMIELARKMGRSHAFVYYHWEHKSSRFAVFRLVLSHLHRLRLQGVDLIGGNTGGVVSLPIVHVEKNLAFYSEYLVQSRRQRKYPPHPHFPLAAGARTHSPSK